MFSPFCGFLRGLIPPLRIEHYAVFGLRISDDPSPTRMFDHRSGNETTPETSRKTIGNSWELGCCRLTVRGDSSEGTRRGLRSVVGCLVITCPMLVSAHSSADRNYETGTMRGRSRFDTSSQSRFPIYQTLNSRCYSHQPSDSIEHRGANCSYAHPPSWWR